MHFKQVVWLMATIAVLASCSSSKKATSSRTGKVIIVDSKSVRIGSAGTTRKDNGLHKGWYKNPNNPHHPNTTNPGHTKGKGKGKGKKK
ncbi:hypothetical protein ABS362_03295 [Pontibacter populi]|uniref:Lipoprotein n=2 Tax=Pontibacter populi TaxID=890055 RepID=A0ABV1RQA6_9BACT